MLEFGGGLGVAVADLHVLSLLLISCYGWFSWVGYDVSTELDGGFCGLYD